MNMEYVITGRKPESVFRFFEDISAIPRPSYHEERIADALVAFAEARGLASYRDASHNVLITLPATKGWEDRPALLFQGHTDMVCEKNSGTEHDFLKDPLKLYLDGKWLRARGTTLGADNGIAVAAMMALLDGAVPAHPRIQCLFTTAEEVGLDGAGAFDYSRISARKMINMDSEALGVVTAGCAGGLRSDITFSLSREEVQGPVLTLSLTGLAGGHSGESINQGRANANKLLGRLLAGLWKEMPFRICDLQGGSKDNAIPREACVKLAVEDPDRAMELLNGLGASIAADLVADDRGFRMTVTGDTEDVLAFSAADTQKLVTLLAAVPNGVFSMNPDIPTLVEFSRNLGVVRTEGDTVDVVFSSRSSKEHQLDVSICELDMIAGTLGASVRHYSRYPGWSYAKHSPLRDAYLASYKAITGEDAVVNVIHAGLECGIISSFVPDMDIISIGPNMKDIHSPDEALDLDSVELFWKTLEKLITDIAL